MKEKAIQDHYPEDVKQCYGCGSLNEHGYKIKTFWDGEASTTKYTPKPYHTAIPNYVYGGLIASIIDCHGTGTAAAAMAQKRKIDLEKENAPRFLTASLTVNYRKPTPINIELLLKGRVEEITERKVIVKVELYAGEELCADGKVIAVSPASV